MTQGADMQRFASITFALLTIATAASAQERNAATPRPSAPAPAARPRIGYAGTPTPAPQPVLPAPVPSYYYYQPGYLQGAPYLVLSDGSVVVNFGYGYERVLRQCAPANGAPVNPWALDPLGRIPAPPGIAALQTGTRGTMAGTAPAQTANACYRLNAQGTPEVVTITGY
jgi:hypothetical protein